MHTIPPHTYAGLQKTFELPIQTVLHPESLYHLDQMSENGPSLQKLDIS